MNEQMNNEIDDDAVDLTLERRKTLTVAKKKEVEEESPVLSKCNKLETRGIF